jgi:nanoRNase/pAp phosphatase (c-di-AMP/oligoRNAs hydrolase)
MPVLAWSWDGKRCNFYCSLRSRDDGPDVSEIAKRFGGGGHEHAAGFRCSRLDAASDVFAEVVKASA